MSLADLKEIIRKSHEETIISMDEYLRKVDINGLHFTTFIGDKGLGCIVNPDYSTNDIATNLLMERTSFNVSPNTLRSLAYDITKFMDYLMLLDINLDEVDDLEEVLIGFGVFLQVFGTSRIRVKRSIEWSLIEFVPLVSDSIEEITLNEYGKRFISKAKTMSEEHILRTMQNAFKYLEYHNKEKPLPLNTIPRRKISKDSSFSSTTKDKYHSIIYDAIYLLAKSGLKIKSNNGLADPTKERIPTVFEMNKFLEVAQEKNKPIHDLLLYTLRGFGIRAAELSNIKFYDAMLPNNFLYLHFDEAIRFIKSNEGISNIYFNNSINRWVCNIENLSTEDIAKRNKSGSREIPYYFEQEEYSLILYQAIRERMLILRANIKHHTSDYLFLNPKEQMKPFKNYTSYNMISTIAKRVSSKTGIDFNWMHPHTFRHFFATYLLRVKKITLDDVSRMLGHSDTKITRGTYIHYFGEEDETTGSIIENMKETFSE